MSIIEIADFSKHIKPSWPLEIEMTSKIKQNKIKLEFSLCFLHQLYCILIVWLDMWKLSIQVWFFIIIVIFYMCERISFYISI